MKPQGPLFDRSWRAACDVVVWPRARAEAMIRAHYIGKWPGVCVLVLGLERAGKPLGCCVFALPPRETAKRYGGPTWELARLWIVDDVPPNAETFLIGRAVRFIRRNRPDVHFLVSYANPSAGHAGTIYRASNWQPDGRTDDERKSPRFDYACAATGKRFSRRSHVPDGVEIVRIPRVSKHRFVYQVQP